MAGSLAADNLTWFVLTIGIGEIFFGLFFLLILLAIIFKKRIADSF